MFEQKEKRKQQEHEYEQIELLEKIQSLKSEAQDH